MADRRIHGHARSSSPLAKIALPRLPGAAHRQDTSAIAKSKVAIACELCRRKRARCDGARPACRRCVEEGEDCKYAVRRRERLLETQQELEEQSVVARSLLSKVIGQVDPATQQEIHKLLSKPLPATEWRAKQDSPSELSRDATGAASVASAGSSDAMAFEFTGRSSGEHSDERPDLVHNIMNTIRYCPPSQVEALVSMIRSNSSAEEIASFITTRMNATVDTAALLSSVQANPMSVHTLCDQPLFSLQAKPWTTVTDDDELVSHLISVYFSWEAFIFPCVLRDLFLGDMLTGRSDFCSPMLVNVILAQACHFSPRLEHRNEPWHERNLSNKFLAEARRLWDVEEGALKLTNVQACLILGIVLNMDGKDRMGTIFANIAFNMAREMSMFDGRPHSSSDSSDALNPSEILQHAARLQLGRDFAAWGVFTYMSTNDFYMKKEAALVRAPTVSHVQFESLSLNDTWTPYPIVRPARPAHLGIFMTAYFELAKIMNKICRVIYKPDTNVTEARVQPLIRRLRKWEQALSPDLDWKVNDCSHNLFLHMQLCSVTLHLCKAVMTTIGSSPRSASSTRHSSEQATPSPPSSLSASPVSSPPGTSDSIVPLSTVSSAALTTLRALVIHYNSQYSWEHASTLMLNPLGQCIFNSLPPPVSIVPSAPALSTEARANLYLGLEALLGMCNSTLLSKLVMRTVQSTIEKMGVVLPSESAKSIAKFDNKVWSVRDMEATRSEYPIDLDNEPPTPTVSPSLHQSGREASTPPQPGSATFSVASAESAGSGTSRYGSSSNTQTAGSGSASNTPLPRAWKERSEKPFEVRKTELTRMWMNELSKVPSSQA